MFCTDLHDFFGSITRERVFRSLVRAGYGEDDASLVAGLCCIDGSLPIGSPCSPVLSNIVCDGLDRFLVDYAERNLSYVTRYADDITFSCYGDLFSLRFVEGLREGVEREGFSLNWRKTRLCDDGMSKRVTGIVVNEFANVPKSYVREVDNLLYIWERHGYDDACRSYASRHPGWHGDLGHALAGKIGWFRHVRPDSERGKEFASRLRRLRARRRLDMKLRIAEETRERRKSLDEFRRVAGLKP